MTINDVIAVLNDKTDKISSVFYYDQNIGDFRGIGKDDLELFLSKNGNEEVLEIVPVKYAIDLRIKNPN